MGEEYQRKNKSEQNHMRDDDDRLNGIDTCEDLVCSVLEFGMDYIHSTKMNELRLLLRYHFGSENLKGSPKKL